VLARLYLVRHGEVHNPDGVVYSDLPGFPLSALGRRQAEAAAGHLADCGAAVVLTSPLERAVETAAIIGAGLGLTPESVPGLTEWGLSLRWAGTEWNRLEERFPGELAAYFAHPESLPFSPESLGAAADRMATVVALVGAYADQGAVLVSHQDPIQALRRRLLGQGWERFHDDKPTHASVITLECGAAGSWRETGHWHPDAGEAFPPPKRR
jgi:broad specificity phosphatase PhoE